MASGSVRWDGYCCRTGGALWRQENENKLDKDSSQHIHKRQHVQLALRQYLHTALCGYGLSTGPTEGLRSWWAEWSVIPQIDSSDNMSWPTEWRRTVDDILRREIVERASSIEYLSFQCSAGCERPARCTVALHYQHTFTVTHWHWQLYRCLLPPPKK